MGLKGATGSCWYLAGLLMPVVSRLGANGELLEELLSPVTLLTAVELNDNILLHSLLCSQ